MTLTTSKVCRRCNIDKSLEDYYQHKGMFDGHLNICKICKREEQAANRQADPEKFKSYMKMHMYGITQAEYNFMLEIQGGRCAICKKHWTDNDKLHGKPKALAIDHNHETKKVRGLLCAQCNRAIGLLGDNLETVLAAALYLETHKDSGF